MVVATECIHHWRIETPAGPTSPGRCLKCGTEREFLNGPQKGWPWGHEKGLPPEGGRAPRRMTLD